MNDQQNERRRLIFLDYYHGMKQKDIGEKYNISKQRIYQIVTQEVRRVMRWKDVELVDRRTLFLNENSPIEDLNLTLKVINALRNGKINTISKLIRFVTKNSPRYVKNIGYKAMLEINETLKNNGFNIR